MDYALPRASDFPLFELCATGIATVDDAGAVTGVEMASRKGTPVAT